MPLATLCYGPGIVEYDGEQRARYSVVCVSTAKYTMQRYNHRYFYALQIALVALHLGERLKYIFFKLCKAGLMFYGMLKPASVLKLTAPLVDVKVRGLGKY